MGTVQSGDIRITIKGRQFGIAVRGCSSCDALNVCKSDENGEFPCDFYRKKFGIPGIVLCEVYDADTNRG